MSKENLIGLFCITLIFAPMLFSGCAGGSYGTGAKTLQWEHQQNLQPDKDKEEQELLPWLWPKKCPVEKQHKNDAGKIECF